MEIRSLGSTPPSPQNPPIPPIPKNIQDLIDAIEKKFQAGEYTLDEAMSALEDLRDHLPDYHLLPREVRDAIFGEIGGLISKHSDQLAESLWKQIDSIMHDQSLSDDQKAERLQNLVNQHARNPHIKLEVRNGLLADLQAKIQTLTLEKRIQELKDRYEKIINDPKLSLKDKLDQLIYLRRELNYLPVERQGEFDKVSKALVAYAEKYIDDLSKLPMDVQSPELKGLIELRNTIERELWQLSPENRKQIEEKIDGALTKSAANLIDFVVRNTQGLTGFAALVLIGPQLEKCLAPEIKTQLLNLLKEKATAAYLEDIKNTVNNPRISDEEKLSTLMEIVYGIDYIQRDAYALDKDTPAKGIAIKAIDGLLNTMLEKLKNSSASREEKIATLDGWIQNLREKIQDKEVKDLIDKLEKAKKSL